MIQVKHTINPTTHLKLSNKLGGMNWHISQYMLERTLTQLSVGMGPIRLYAKYKLGDYYKAIQTYKSLKLELNI